MFLLRSAFWLGLAFLVMKPGPVDLADTAETLSASALAAGQQLIVEQIENTECASLQCFGGKALLSAALNPAPSAGSPMQDSPAEAPVPLPRPRPERAG